MTDDKASFRDPYLEQLTRLVELVTTECPELVSFFIEIVSNSHLRSDLLELATTLGINVDVFRISLAVVIEGLEQLETAKWKHPEEVLSEPNIGALLVLCRARRARISGKVREKRLAVMERKLESAYKTQTTQRWIEGFIRLEGHGV